MSCLGFAASAAADDGYNGTVQASQGLNVRSCVNCTDGVPSTSLPWLLTLPNGTRVHINCYYRGQTVSGNWGNTNIWDVVQYWQLPDGSTGGFSPGPPAVATDGFIFTGSDNPVVPHC